MLMVHAQKPGGGPARYHGERLLVNHPTRRRGSWEKSESLVLVRHINWPCECWKYNRAQRKQSRRFLKLQRSSWESVSKAMRENDHWTCCSGRERAGGRWNSWRPSWSWWSWKNDFWFPGEVRRTATFDFQRANFCMVRGLADKVPWEGILEDKGIQEHWIFFKVQEQVEPMCHKIRQWGRMAWPLWTESCVWNSGRKKGEFATFGWRVSHTEEDNKGEITQEEN